MKALLSKVILGTMLVATLTGCAALGTSPLTDAQRFGPTAEIPL